MPKCDFPAALRLQEFSSCLCLPKRQCISVSCFLFSAIAVSFLPSQYEKSKNEIFAYWAEVKGKGIFYFLLSIRKV